jgi:cation-transporting P-type ATPase E
VVATASHDAPAPLHRSTGLTHGEVRVRVERGAVNRRPTAPARTLAQIVRANVLTRFNALLGTLAAIVLMVGDPRDALFAGVLIANSAIGIAQEVRAKRALDRMALLEAPRVTAIREGTRHIVAVDEVVLDDVLCLRAGDQVVVDGCVVEADGLEIDESLLTGESEPISKVAGDGLLSGSFVVAGSGTFRATRVGADSYAAALTIEAGDFALARSTLRAGIDRILAIVTWALIPTALLLAITQPQAHADTAAGISSAIAGVVAMVPEGLVLLTSGAFAVAVLRLSRHRTLVQQLPSVETLARVDVLCLDKTGTLTEGTLAVTSVEPVGSVEGDQALPTAVEALAALAAATPDPNPTMAAIAAHTPVAPSWTVVGTVPFSSARRWTATSFADVGTWVLGAPDVVLAAAPDEGVGASVTRRTMAGERVVVLARCPRLPVDEVLPAGIEAAALVVLGDRVREAAPRTIRFFAEQGVSVRVLSGDDPRTVAAVCRQAGLDDHGIDARRLPADEEELAEALERSRVFGRVTPRQKQQMVAALRSRGHVVAMTGDGVNDVLALKEADIGIAIGSGASAARAVSDLVLLDGSFDSLPTVVREGRRVIGNVHRVAKLFVTKSVYAFLLAVAVAIPAVPFPFLPRHLTLVGSLTIGLPGIILALGVNDRPVAGGFVGRVLRFAVPAGVVAAAATFYVYDRANALGADLAQARTAATLALVAIGLSILARLTDRTERVRLSVLITMAAGMVLVLVVPPLRDFFALRPPPAPVWFLVGAVVGAAVLAFPYALSLAGRLGRGEVS